MARQTSDREDLYEELHLAVPRWELLPVGEQIPVVAGIRPDGRLLLYLTPDHVYQFDSENRLLRSYQGGDLFRTQGTTLARLRRHRTDSTSELLRYDLSPAECNLFLDALRASLQSLLSSLSHQETRLLRTTESSTAPLEKLKSRISACLNVQPQLAPSYRTRRK